MREQITAITNKAEAFHGYAEWLMIGGNLIGHSDPDYQERMVKFNELTQRPEPLQRRSMAPFRGTVI